MVLKKRAPHICIIGAGVSGLRAADVLTAHGANVTIYEARNRVGGRVAQSSYLGHLVDLGPNWIHGTDFNPLIPLASKTNTTLHTWPERQIVFDSDGSRIPDSEVAEIAEGFWSIVSDAFAYSRENTARISAGESLFDFVKQEAEDKWSDEGKSVGGSDDVNGKQTGGKGVIEKRRKRLLKEAEMWGAFVGSPVQTQSLKFFWLEETINGENPFVASTYQKIMEEIARPALTSAKAVLKLSTKVDAVKYGNANGDGDGAGAGVVIEVEGRQEEYDEVIVTAPLGWLQRNQDTFFDPPLPERLSKAIKNIGYGNLDKVLITFPKAFWEETSSPQDGDTSSNSKDAAPNVTATTQPHHQSEQQDDDSHYPPFTLFYSDKESHIQNAMNLASLPPPHAHPTLLFYIFGSSAAEIAKLTSDKEIINYFRPHFSLIDGYSPSNPDCEPSAVLSTNWTSDELAGYGSYSTFRTGLEEGDKDIEIMRHGLPESHIWFAGEHTSPFEALGTVTGAYWSGEGVAGRILMGYGLDGKE